MTEDSAVRAETVAPLGTATHEPAVVRPMTWRDLAEVLALEPVLFAADAWSERQWWAELAQRPRRSYLVAAQAGSGSVLGYAGLDHAGDTADVMTIAVAPQAQGRGIGRVLVDALVTAAAQAQAQALLLEVRADNAGAIALYERTGFDRIAVRRRYYQPGDVDALVMRLLLADGHRSTGLRTGVAATSGRKEPA